MTEGMDWEKQACILSCLFYPWGDDILERSEADRGEEVHEHGLISNCIGKHERKAHPGWSWYRRKLCSEGIAGNLKQNKTSMLKRR